MDEVVEGSLIHTSRMGKAASLRADARVERLVAVGRRGLRSAYDPASGGFAQTLRGMQGRTSLIPMREGSNLRYAAIAALGINRLDLADQREILAGATAVTLAARIQILAAKHGDPGVVALSAWATAEIAGRYAGVLFGELDQVLNSGRPVDTVSLSWMLTAATMARFEGISASVAERVLALLVEAQGPNGIFPHAVPAVSQSRWRRHVGSFADQIYPIQALARTYALTGDRAALAAAEATADRICELQGPDGQWWWHYDVRTGQTVERYPVYSVHQHAMAPMGLFDLAESGGTDRIAQIIAGVGWIDQHPEVTEDLLIDESGVVWRKVGRREPAKAVRKISAVTTSVRAGTHIRGLDLAFPAHRVDHECRPYELGWLLYAWLPPRIEDRHE